MRKPGARNAIGNIWRSEADQRGPTHGDRYDGDQNYNDKHNNDKYYNDGRHDEPGRPDANRDPAGSKPDADRGAKRYPVPDHYSGANRDQPAGPRSDRADNTRLRRGK